MKHLKLGTLLILITVFLASCGGSRTTVTYNPKTKQKPTVDQTEIALSQSDEVFYDIKKRYGSGLSAITMAYVKRYKDVAIDDMQEFRIPASITLAQGILESGSGRSELSSKSNNHFGIKCHKDWKGQKVYHNDDRKGECFRKYKHPEESFDDHSKFFRGRSRYAFLFDLKPDDYEGWAKGLRKAGYATDKKYPAKLIKIIQDYHLYAYDALVMQNKGYKKTKQQSDRSSKGIAVSQSNKYIIVKKGDTLYSLSRANSISVENLKRINNLHSNEISIDQKLYLE